MTGMDFPSSPTNGQQTADGRYYFDSSVGTAGGWRSTPLPVGGLPAGSIMAWATNTPPANWLLADGSAVSRSVYSSLFAVIGTQYGVGDGSTTFTLPDLRGRVPVGKNGGTFGTLGATGGAETHTLTEAQLPPHKHTVNIDYKDDTGAHNHGSRGGQLMQGSLNRSGVSTDANTMSTVGSGQAHNILQPYQVVNYVIKASAGWTAGDSELATRVGAVETANATTNKAGLVPVVPSTISVSGGTATANSLAVISFDSVTSLSLNNCFSAAYRNYKVIIKLQGQSGTGGYVAFRFRSGGSDFSGASYHSSGMFARPSSGSGALGGSSQSYFPALEYVAMNDWTLVANMDIFDPFLTDQTSITDLMWNYDGTGPYASFRNGMVYSTSQYDGFSIIPTGNGVLSGTVQILGYRN